MGIMSLKAFERWKMMTGMENEIVMDIRTMHILSNCHKVSKLALLKFRMS